MGSYIVTLSQGSICLVGSYIVTIRDLIGV